MRSIFVAMFAFMILISPLEAQQADDQQATRDARAATGGAQTLEDILARQSGKSVDDSFRRGATGNPQGAADTVDQLGTFGGTSDPELWRALRYGTADISTQNRGPAATVLVQDGGMWWLQFRAGTLRAFGVYLLGGTLLLLAAFYIVRGRIRIDGEKTGVKIERFKLAERFGHWMLASSFIVLGLTGLLSLFGRTMLIPFFGPEAFAFIATGSKWVHNNISWAFILALIIIFFFWAVHNLPDRTDLNWLAKGGGILGKGHPTAKKFNAGQKLIFWAVILLGGSISLSGLSLLFPFEINLFGPTFTQLNAFGVPGWFGMPELPTALTPQEEMQYSQLWHALVSLCLTAIIFAHIYIGTVGMEGAFDAVGTGKVEERWAREHHSLWLEELDAKRASADKES